MDQYEAQLLAVEQALLATEDANKREELCILKENLIELMALTKFVDEEKRSNDSMCGNIDYEIEKFMNEIKQVDSEEELQHTKEKLERMVGRKCSAPHMHSWGAVTYHNALICSIENEASIDDDDNVDVKFRILFTNPTHREMLPCSFYLDGNCRFDSENCHFSHGEVVYASSLRKYAEPDFTRLSRNCIVLAKTEDRLWHRGRVLCANFVEKECRIRLDNSSMKDREKDVKFEDLLPIYEGDEDSTSDTESESDFAEISDDNINVETFTYELNQPLGEWEKYTKGIGSKLMSKMGYVYGTGLGTRGNGIITPITAQILPQGRSLDHCMKLREAANGDKNLFSAEKKLQKQKKKQEVINAKAYDRETNRVDVFSFLNENILTNPGVSNNANLNKNSLQSHSSKSLNVESVKVADDIRRKQREIDEVKKSLKRNADGCSDICIHLKKKLQEKYNELNRLKDEQTCLSNEQTNRRTKSFVF